MTSKQASRSCPSDGEHKGMCHRIKGALGLRKKARIPQARSRVAQSEEGSSNDLQHPKPEMAPGNTVNRQKSTFATDQERHPPLIQRRHSDNMITAGDVKKSGDLWLSAYEALKRRDPDLVAAYERLLVHTTTDLADLSLSPELIETIIKSKLDDREAKQLVINLGEKPVKVREQGEKIIKFILWSKDIISQALSAQPYAALAWSGVSILLPLLLNSSQQSQTMIEGLSFISDLLRLYRVKEELYLQDADKPARPNFVQAVVELYSNIFEYQTRMIYHLSQGSFKRAIRGTLELDNWGDMLEKVKTSDNICKEYCDLSDRERENSFYNNSSTHMLLSVDIQKRVLNMFEESQASRERDRRDDKEAELLRTLASDYRGDKDSVSARVPGTCEWFFEDDRFLKWRDSEHSRLLWVSAGPGCGKSVLSRSLIDERRVCTSAMTSTVCYFFFKDGQNQRMRSANALSAILHQLFKNTALARHALRSAKSYGEKLQDTMGELWDILIKCAQDSEAGEIICILDALDECEKDSRSQLLEKLTSFYSHIEAHNSPSHKLKFLVTSRPYDHLEERFRSLTDDSTYVHFDGDDKSQRIGEEINLVIDYEMPRIAKGFSAEDCKRIANRLKEMDNRTYLWLFLTLDIITGSQSKYSKMSSLDLLLSRLPSKVSDAYEEILSKSSDEDTARVLLQLIVAATRPLSLEEVNIALTLATQGTRFASHNALDQDLWPQQDFKSVIRNMCGLFISVHDGKVSLIHQTAREFLIRNPESPELQSGKWQGYLDMATAHCTLSQVCLDYLNFDDFASIAVDQLEENNYTLQGPYLLCDYAALNWAVHYYVAQDSEQAKDLCGAAKNLCNTSLPQQSCWFKMYCDSNHLKREDWTSLTIASMLGLKCVAESFLDEGADVNAQSRRGNALQAASSKGYDQVVQMLLNKGADVNAKSKFLRGCALHVASEEGHSQIVQILLDKGADVEARGSDDITALQLASAGGHSQIVQILLDKGANVDARERDGTALQLASKEGHSQIVQILLDKGANIDARGRRGTALQLASAGGYSQIVQILLDKGADVNAPGSYGNALQLASTGGHDHVVQILLDKGADVNALGRYGTALDAASKRRHSQVVQMLLDRGAVRPDIPATLDR